MAGKFTDSTPCKKCGGFEFYRNNGGSRACTPCVLEKGRSYRRRNPEKTKALAKRQHLARVASGRGIEKHLRLKYGITVAERDQILADQDGRCAICRADEPPGKNGWHIDHDHATGNIRGILCGNCNTGIGMLADDPVRVFFAAKYLVSARAKEAGNEEAANAAPLPAER